MQNLFWINEFQDVWKSTSFRGEVNQFSWGSQPVFTFADKRKTRKKTSIPNGTWGLSILNFIKDIRIFWIWSYPMEFWISFQVEVFSKLQEELLQLITNVELQLIFKRLPTILVGRANTYSCKYCILSGLYEGKFVIAFLSSYVMERMYSPITNLFTKKKEEINRK